MREETSSAVDAHADVDSRQSRLPYEAPELTEFGPMRDLTNFDPGPTEDFILYGGAS